MATRSKKSTRTSEKRCKDCLTEGVRSKREAKYPGPRCYTHHRKRTVGKRDKQRSSHVERTYGITEEQYQAIYQAQGGVCAICRRANGKGRKRLAVDHDHSCCSGPTSCGRCVRSLCCTTCNRMLGHIRDDPEIAERILWYLVEPPGREVLREWSVQSTDADDDEST